MPTSYTHVRKPSKLIFTKCHFESHPGESFREMRCFNKFSKDAQLIYFLIAEWYSVWRKVAQVKQDLKCNPLPAIVNIFWSAIVSTCICICVFNIKISKIFKIFQGPELRLSADIKHGSGYNLALRQHC